MPLKVLLSKAQYFQTSSVSLLCGSGGLNCLGSSIGEMSASAWMWHWVLIGFDNMLASPLLMSCQSVPAITNLYLLKSLVNSGDLVLLV